MHLQSRLYRVGRLLPGVFALSAAVLYSYQAQAATDQPPIPPGVAMKSWQDNGLDGRYLLQLAPGKSLKAGKRVTGTVTSDTDCEIDAEGLSHCHNNIKLADGSEITVIDTHNMHRYRCLGAGDRISLTGMKGPWIMGTLSEK